MHPPLYPDSLSLAFPPLHTLFTRHSFAIPKYLLSLTRSSPRHVSDMSVLFVGSRYQALEATPMSTSSPPRVDSDLAAKFNFTDDEESGPPNFKFESEAVETDLDFEQDRMTIVASWRAHANLLMLFVRRRHPRPPFFSPLRNRNNPHANLHVLHVCMQSGLLSALIATQLLRACWAARPVLPGSWVVYLVRVFQLMGNAAVGASGTPPSLPPLPLPLSTSRSPGLPTKTVLLPLALPALTRALWLTSLAVGLGCTLVASLLKERACRDLHVTRSPRRWRYRPHERKGGEYDASFFGGEVLRPMVDLTKVFHAIHAFHLLSVTLYLWGLGIPLLRASGSSPLLVIVGSGATFFIGQCLIVSALPRVTR